ncbi:hypothetical protein A2690_04915 [Candidatus Roizmanbacteria bacterium RIFCSPHIGHO2_01_FULL_39_12b]|uniref:AB hydrolase-1 domain-containing protein n=1 Tax=Candidatus Roizmanbacteria bacterium RIFCSPHIGHO2_01_FULL_39_12b TaxID=1802030 RepID=A0A1F7GCK2_9BACT|nr:MAG: hypothetical protein A2690_04915 [Candidatus Roizmanbacteria bacterium RIFCSPHIGHO2_01_FULL_39_12b]
MEFKRHTLKDDGKTFTYWTLGNNKKQSLLILPGLTGQYKDLAQFIHHLEKNNFIIIPDLPGWGESQQLDKKHNLTEYSHFLKKVLDDAEIDKTVIVGHCLGSLLAITFAKLFPTRVNKLFLITPPYEDGSMIFGVLKHMGELSQHMPRAVQSLFFLWRNRFVGFAAAMFLLRFKSFRKRAYYSLKTLDRSNEVEDVVIDNTLSIYHFNWNVLKYLNQPIYVFHGERDLVIMPKKIEQLIEKLHGDIVFELIPNAGHLPPIETPETLARMILEHI